MLLEESERFGQKVAAEAATPGGGGCLSSIRNGEWSFAGLRIHHEQVI
jgi:hypothetical protein